MKEYRVMEVEDDGYRYKHGYEGSDKVEAYARLKHMRDFYGKYGRKFVIEIRTVTPWMEDEECPT